MLDKPYNKNGFTLIELVVTLGVFGILSTMLYGTFNLVSSQVGNISTQNSLDDKGQRILSYIEEDIRMTAYLLGPDASIPYCAGENNGIGGTLPASSPTLDYTSGNPYDSLSIITSVPVTLKETAACKALFTAGSGAQKDCTGGTNLSSSNLDRIDYFLTSQCESVAGILAGTVAMYVDAGGTCYDDIALGTSTSKNGRSLVTFDSLLLSASAVAGSAPQVYYSLTEVGNSFKFNETLQQNVPDGSTVYNVRMYRYLVDTGSGKRNLKRVGWDSNCSIGADVTTELIETTNSTNTAGGVDGLKFEFIYLDTINNRMATCSDINPIPSNCSDLASNAGGPLPLAQLRAVRVWLLLRADKVDKSYTDKGSYVLGSTTNKITLGPYNDNYRRVLLNKTVEVKNLARIY